MKTANAELDLALVKAVRGDDTKKAKLALEKLFDKYHNLILFRYKNVVKNETDAEDLAIEAFTKCYENINQYNEQNAFSTWLFALTRNLFIDKIRKKRAIFTSISDIIISDEDGHFTEKEFEAPELTPDKELIRNERNAQLRDLINVTFKDKPHLKELIELRYFCDLSYKEIQNLTGIPLNTIKAHLFRAKNTIKKACLKTNLKI